MTYEQKLRAKVESEATEVARLKNELALAEARLDAWSTNLNYYLEERESEAPPREPAPAADRKPPPSQAERREAYRKVLADAPDGMRTAAIRESASADLGFDISGDMFSRDMAASPSVFEQMWKGTWRLKAQG